MRQHVPVLIDVGTSSYDDAAKIIEAVREDSVSGAKHLVWGDMQTFQRLWWRKFNCPASHQDICPLAGEFHAGRNAITPFNLIFYFSDLAVAPFKMSKSAYSACVSCVLSRRWLRAR